MDRLNQQVKNGLEELQEQCQAYAVITPPQNIFALSMLENFQRKIEALLEECQMDETAEGETHLVSAREKQVLQLIALGHPNKEIAYQLSISPKTVQFHIKSIFTKLKVGSRTEAVTKAIKLQIISL
jgi:DNA-binding NarL/FixJ family response regulator